MTDVSGGGPVLVTISSLSKNYGNVRALRDISFQIRKGEVLALAGENGSGKSTLARILAGALTHDSGHFEVDGAEHEFSSPHDGLAAGIALVTQEITSMPDLSIAENVLLARMTNPFSRFRVRQAAAQAQPYLDLVDVAGDPAAPFSTLRMGDRERVEIARALATEPKLLILDEATSRLGPDDVEGLFAILRTLRDQGVAVIIITHRLNEITQLADRAVVLRDGALVGDLAGDEITEEKLVTLMVGRELTEFFPAKTVKAHGEPVLRVENLLVDGTDSPISFDLRPGQVLGLSGLVGSGRSELLETIAGVRPFRNGRVIVGGRELKPGSVRSAMNAGVVLVPEDRHRQGLVLTTTVSKNLAMSGWRAISPARAGAERAVTVAAIKRLGIKTPGPDASILALSGGNQQKVVIGRSIAANPKVLLLDEPARGIDVGAKAEIFHLIYELLRDGMAIVMASSDMIEVLGMSDTIMVLHEGQSVAELPRSEATEENLALLAAGGGRR